MIDKLLTRDTLQVALPNGWLWVKFDDTCEPVSDGGRKVPQKAYSRTGKYPIVDQGEDLIGGYTDDAGMVFTGKTPVIAFGDHTRRFKFIDWPFVVGADGVKLIASSGAWDAKCLWFFLRALKFEDRGYSRHFQFLRRALLPLPPLNEQRRIAELLDELLSDLDAGVAALEQVQTKLTLYRAAVLKAALEGAMTAEWRQHHHASETGPELVSRILAERRRRWEEEHLRKCKDAGKAPAKNWKSKYKEPRAPETTSLPSLPEGWCWATVDQLSVRVVDGVHKKPRYVSSGVPFVTVRNLTAGSGISFTKLNYVTPADHAGFIKRAHPQRGDILISKDGTLGTIRLVNTDVAFSIFVSVALVKPVLLEMSNFFSAALSAPQVQGQMVPKGSGLEHIHLEDLREDCIPVPPLEEQQVIIEALDDQLSVIDHLEMSLEARLTSAQVLQQAILRHAFIGELVPQDPNDETASELLKRTAAERAERANGSGTAKREAKHSSKVLKLRKVRASRRRRQRGD